MRCPAVLCAGTVVLTTVAVHIRHLTEKEAVAAVGYAHRPYAIAAWRFLTKTGYINFGVVPGMSAQQSGKGDQPPKGTVIVVGAGMAGKIAVCAWSLTATNQAACVQACIHHSCQKLHASGQHGCYSCAIPCILHEVSHEQ